MAKYARQRRRSAALRDLFGPEAVPAKLKMPRVPPLSPRSSKTASTNVPGGSLSNSLHLFLETSRASDFNQPSPLGPASPVIEAFDALIVQPSADSKSHKRVPPLSPGPPPLISRWSAGWNCLAPVESGPVPALPHSRHAGWLPAFRWSSVTSPTILGSSKRLPVSPV